MNPEQTVKLADALTTISLAQHEIMHGLTYLAMEHGETLPGVSETVDKYSEWLETMHRVMVEAEQFMPRTIVVIPTIQIDVL